MESNTNPPQTARPNASPKSASDVLGSASNEAIGAVAMGLRVAALSGNLAPHIPPLISVWSAELAEQHRRPAYERAIRTTLDLYPTPRSRPVSSLSPRQRATAACEPPEPPKPPEPPRPSSMIKVPPLKVPDLGPCISTGCACLLRAAYCSQEESPGPTGCPATAAGARASRLHSRRFHRL
eukprot:scaffold115194_cov62-Phaeocystis_antarctica.AAC.3